MLEDPERGHRLDGMIARLKYLAPKAQFLYLSATIGSPKVLAKKLGAALVQYDERPVALERYLIFTPKKEKIGAITDLQKKNTSKFHQKDITVRVLSSPIPVRDAIQLQKPWVRNMLHTMQA